MQENIALTKEVNELRREKYHILVQQKSKEAAKRPGAASSGAPGSAGPGGRAGKLARSAGGPHGMSHDAAAFAALSNALPQEGEETEVQQEQIRALKKQLALLEAEYQEVLQANTGQSARGGMSARGGASLQPGEKLPQLKGMGSAPVATEQDIAEVNQALQDWKINGVGADEEKQQR
jgi:hypothetical protein